MATEKDLYNEQLEGNNEAVNGMFESLIRDYTISQLHSLAEAADISINICNKFKISGVAVPDGISYTYAAIGFFNDIADYKDAIENGYSEEALYAEKVQICANIMSVFGTLTGEIDILKPLSAPLTYGADCLHAGAEIIQNRIVLLDDYEKLLDEALGWDDVADDNSVLISADEDYKYYDNLLSELKNLRSALRSAGEYDGSLDGTISELESALSQFDNKANNIIDKVEDKTGYHANDLSNLANRAASEKNKSNGGDWTESTTEDTTEDTSNDYEESSDTEAPRDPLVIDLGKQGIELTDVENGVHFDLDKNELAEKTAWIGTEDGFLVLDRNGNGIIDNGGELFGDQVVMSNGVTASTGFEALADLDDNANESEDSIGDGVIDEKDAEFSNLRVWVDKDHDGITDEGELKTLEELGITSISLDHTNKNEVDTETGTIITESSVVNFIDGITSEISEHWFEVKSYDTEERDEQGNPPEVDSVEAFGNVKSLNTAIAEDETGELGTLVEQFKACSDYLEKRLLIKKILYFITGANEIAANSRGGNIDARDLYVIEQFMGRNFVGVEGGSTPNSNAAAILRKVYAQIENMYFNLLNKESGIDEYLNLIFECIDDDGNRNLDTTLFECIIERRLHYGESVDNIVYGVASWLYQYDSTYGTNTFANFNTFMLQFTDQYTQINEYISASVVLGTRGNDSLNGSSAKDIVWLEDGDDIVAIFTVDNICSCSSVDGIISSTAVD